MLMSAMFNIPAFQSHFKIAPKQSLCRTSSSAAAAAPSPPPSISPNTLPSVRYLQTMIEAAWQNGFDRDGASHFKFKLVNSRSWIGTTEICAMMRYYGVKAYCFDVREPSGPNNSHPDIFDFVERYYQGTLLGIDSNNCGSGVGSSSITTDDILVTDRPPIYFQHQGHSRTIVGIEKLQTGLRRLLIFDPADRSVSNAVNSPNWESNFLAKGFLNSCRLGNDDLSKRKQYQLLVVGGTTNWDRNSFNEAKIIYPNIIAHHLWWGEGMWIETIVSNQKTKKSSLH